jgi:hypothetical protein
MGLIELALSSPPPAPPDPMMRFVETSRAALAAAALSAGRGAR